MQKEKPSLEEILIQEDYPEQAKYFENKKASKN
jgi:hypothetical protein